MFDKSEVKTFFVSIIYKLQKPCLEYCHANINMGPDKSLFNDANNTIHILHITYRLNLMFDCR